MRPIDLARAGGVSAQQVRNYVEAGVLPAVPRTASGYRRFGHRHLRALLAYRALGSALGWVIAREIMLAVHAGDTAHALALIDEGHAGLHEQRGSLRATARALADVAGQVPDTTGPRRADLRIGEVARRLGVRPSALRVWESAGLLSPRREGGTGYRRYRPADVRDARVVHLLRESRYPLDQIGPVLDDLREAGSTEELRAAIARREESLTQRAAAMLAAASHLHGYLEEGS
ncbi:MerR family transcriptional regulator [Prauserella shujinwangii]|uniref:MerR family transcriptional regulator n=1 Tax=Prauserella shujinwangii TaxID=1453103 RepID=UPI001FE31178|nr:MerR family transcriptional regulator [Prauserella shujinwangii]